MISLIYSLLINSSSNLLIGTGWPVCIEVSPRGFYASHTLRQILVYVYTIHHCGQILISGIISSGSLFPPSLAKSWSPFRPVCCIHWSCHKLFHLDYYITYTDYFLYIINFCFIFVITPFTFDFFLYFQLLFHFHRHITRICYSFVYYQFFI